MWLVITWRARILSSSALRTRCADFGATLASEKLGEVEGVRLSKETVHQIQVRARRPAAQATARQEDFAVRERRPYFGEPFGST
jgi:hypothetical protein